MAKQSKSQLQAELETRGVTFPDDANSVELQGIIDADNAKREAKLEPPKNPDFRHVPNGEATANDHEQRITILERKFADLEGK